MQMRDNPLLPRTKIVATVGTPGMPSAERQTLARLAEAGVSVFRLNFSHGELDQYEQTLRRIREVENDAGRPIGVLGDLSGPKIRVGPVVKGGIYAQAGEDVVFQRQEIVAEGLRFSVTYPGLIDDIAPGQKLLVNDGAVRMLVVDRSADEITCRVITPGLISSGKGINLPATDLHVDAITDKDWICLEWAVAHELDFVAMSFVRRADEVRQLKARLIELAQANNCRPIPIVAKIEKPEALDNLQAILDEVDVIMVARGDLGVEMDLARVPIIQKQVVESSLRHGTPCIVATQMLESMIHSPVPTRAEASDVANAILDGADAIMLSGETAVGRHPVLTVATMCRIAESTETFVGWQSRLTGGLPQQQQCRLDAGHWTGAIAAGTQTIAREIDAKLIVAWTRTGVTAIHLSQNRFPVPVVVCSDDLCTLRRLTVLHGIIPLRMSLPASIDQFTSQVSRVLLEMKLAEPGDAVIVLAGHPVGQDSATNSLAVHYLGNPSMPPRKH